MSRLRDIVIAIAVMVSGFGMAATVPAATASADCSSHFLTFPTWYDGLLTQDGKCQIAAPNGDRNGGGLSTFIFRIVLNIIEIVLQLVGYAAAGYVIYGGFKYLTSAGDSSRVTAGRKIIQNALIGLVISIMSVAIVNLVAGNISGRGSDGCTQSGTKIDADCVGVAKVNAQSAIDGVLNTAYFAAGMVAVVVIIISAFFYVASQGDAGKTKRAKDGILYAVVGLVVILFAFIITNFVIGRF